MSSESVPTKTGWFRSFAASSSILTFAALGGAVVLTAGATLYLQRDNPKVSHCAVMPDAIGLYPGNKVTVRGFQVGTVDRIEDSIGGAKVTFKIDSERWVSADTGAVTVSDNLVADRRLELIQGKSAGTIPADRCLTDTKTPLSITDALTALTKVIRDVTAGGTDLSPIQTINKLAAAVDGLGPTIQRATNEFGMVITDPSAGVADIGALIDALDGLAGGAAANWPELTTTIGDINYLLGDVVDGVLYNDIGGVLEHIGPTLKVLIDLLDRYNFLLWPTLDVIVPAAQVLANGMRNFGDLLGLLPPIINGFVVNVDQDTLATQITYRPPSATMPARDAELTCKNVNFFAPGQCTVVDPGHINVNIATTVLNFLGVTQ